MTRDLPDSITLGAGAEFDAIRAMQARWGDRARGLGDDAALLSIPRGDQLVVSVDAAIEGRHFRRDWLTSREIGYRAVTAALSDLAAMAATPRGVLVALGVPAAWRDNLLDLADGIGDAAAAAHAPILGGNLADANELSITTTVLGSAFAPLARSGAKAGDRVYVTGQLGGTAVAIAAMNAGACGDKIPHRERIVRPAARIAEAEWLAEHGASAAVDISDGLLADAGHLAAASAVVIDIDAARVSAVSEATREQALGSGEEYELVVAAPAPFDTAEFERRFGIPLTEIGRVSRAASPSEAGVGVTGARAADVARYDHFASSVAKPLANTSADSAKFSR